VSGRAISAVSLDFFNTLAYHRQGQGRGALLVQYFRDQGWSSDRWQHSVLYDLFAAHGPRYSAQAAIAPDHGFCVAVARTLFELLHVNADPALAEEHALALWSIVGPDHLTLFPDVHEGLRRLRDAGLRVVVVSNWHTGLTGFCRSLGLETYFESVVASADVGFAKPDARIFSHACNLLALPPDQVLHVGDSATDDVAGAKSAGLRALLLQRSNHSANQPCMVRSLLDIHPIA
jgi:HAD superfamily hydrolase (TIGR01549 family)